MTANAPGIVSTEIADGIGLIALNNPPVNAASHALRLGLSAALQRLGSDPAVKAIAIWGATRAFIAGADIREFGKPIAAPGLPQVCAEIEACKLPVVAVLHGATLGGGLEVALSAHARVALPDLLTGFPEVTLGVLPGAGGTQRGPRLIGIAAALDLATSGRRIGAEEALALGLVDRIAQGTPRQVAMQAAQAALAGELPVRRTSSLAVAADDAALADTAARLGRSQAHLFSPHLIVQAIAASTGDFAAGMALERKLFLDCVDSPQRAGLIHAFFAERAVAKVPEASATPREIASLGVVGGGTMGSGIATAALLAGLPVVLADRDDAALDRARAAIAANLDGAVRRGKLKVARRAAILSDALTLTTDLAAFASADCIVEAVFEDMQAKHDVFARLDKVARPGTILATNTSYLDVNEIALGTSRPGDVLGLHFFSPAHVMRLLEVVVADRTAPEVTATGFALARRLGKVAVRSGVCDGFIGNRILAQTRKVADYLVMDGAAPQQVDRALQKAGFAMGPFAVADLAGLDIGWANRKRLAPTRDPAERYVAIADRLCERGWFGRKTGRGWYLYDGAAPTPNPEAAALIEAERRIAGIAPRAFSDEEIVERYLAAMIAEACRILEEGIALRPIDIDAVLLFGYGFPRHLGGPMHHADTLGAATLTRQIQHLASEDPWFWKVPGLLQDLAESGGTLAALNAANGGNT